MKIALFKKILSLIVPFFFFYSGSKCQTINSYYSIATWKGFAQSAVSYTWDDNTAKQLTDALPLFDRYGFKITFFVITNTNPNWNGLKTAQDNGHEIASHTLSHPSLNILPDSNQEKEEKEAQAIINKKMMNKQCLTLAYPFCALGNRTITSKYYIAARGCNGKVESKTPNDFQNISSIVCGTQGTIKSATDFNAKTNEAASFGGWVVFLLHGINNDGGFSPIDSSELSKHLDYVHANPKKFWVSSFENVVKYIRERDASVINESERTNNRIAFSITHPLDTSIYNFPITVKSFIPNGWKLYYATQNGNQIPVSAINENGKKYIAMDVLPNLGEIVIKKSSNSP